MEELTRPTTGLMKTFEFEIPKKLAA